MQQITISVATKKMLECLFDYIYPIIPGFNENEFWSNSSKLLFIQYNLKPIDRLYNYILAFYQKKLNLNINTTIIRSLWSTESTQLYKEGKISLAQKVSIDAINGHSGQTAEEFYHKDNVHIHITNSTTVSQTINQSSNNELNVPLSKSNFESLPWGTKHQNINEKDKKQIKWSNEELEYLKKTASNLLKEDEEKYEKHLMKYCLQKIISDPEAVALFHPNHTLSTNHLKDGYEQLNRKSKKRKEK